MQWRPSALVFSLLSSCSFFFSTSALFPPSVNFQRSLARARLLASACSSLSGGKLAERLGARRAPALSRGKWELAWSRFDHARNRGADRTRARKHPSAAREAWRSIDSRAVREVAPAMMAAVYVTTTFLSTNRISRGGGVFVISNIRNMYSNISRE